MILIRENAYLEERILDLKKEIMEWIGDPSLKITESEDIEEKSSFSNPSTEEMVNALIQFSNADVSEDSIELSAKFISWGSRATNFLLEEHKTNRYGYSNTSGAVMDLNYPNWRKKEKPISKSDDGL